MAADRYYIIQMRNTICREQ